MEGVVAQAGSLGMFILALGGLGALVALALAAVSVTMRRVPLTAWLLFPMLVIAAGAFATWIQSGEVLDAAAAAGSSMADVAATGLARSWAADYLSRWVAGGLLILSAWGAALGAFRVGKYSVWTTFGGVMTVLSTVVGAGAVLTYTLLTGLTGGFWLVAAILAGGIGLAAAAMRRAYYEEANRVAGLRFTAAVLFFMGVVQTGRALLLGVRMDIFAIQPTLTPDELETAIPSQLALLGDVTTLVWIAIVLGFAVAAWAFVAELGEVVQKYTVWDAFAASALLAAVLGIRMVELERVETVQEVALLQPMPSLIDEYGYDLPTASLVVDGQLFDAHLGRAGFGDALALQEGQWVRKWAWTGRSWEADETPITAETPIADKPVLLAVESGEPALPVLEMVEKLGGEAILLLRAGELDDELPAEAAHLEGTLLPVRISTTRDFTKEPWVDADRFDLYSGPIRAFGEGLDEREPVRRLDAFYDAHEEATGLHVAVGERSRISNVAELCLSAMVVPEEPEPVEPAEGEEVEEEGEEPKATGIALREGAWCALTSESPDDLIAAAAEAAPLEDSPRVTLSARVDNIEPIAKTLVEREQPALGWCAEAVEKAAAEDAEAAIEEGEEPAEVEPVRGKLAVEFQVDERGRATEYTWEDRGTIDSPALRSCVKERLERVRFPIVEEVVAEAPPEGEAEGEEPEEVEEPDPRVVTLSLTYR